jgi:rhamnogalacturonyl hydrolase YesR
MDRRRCQVKAVIDTMDPPALTKAMESCLCWRCHDWREFSATSEYRQAILEGMMQGVTERAYKGHA